MSVHAITPIIKRATVWMECVGLARDPSAGCSFYKIHLEIDLLINGEEIKYRHEDGVGGEWVVDKSCGEYQEVASWMKKLKQFKKKVEIMAGIGDESSLSHTLWETTAYPVKVGEICYKSQLKVSGKIPDEKHT